MNKYSELIKENPALAAGVLLPVGLVILFMLAALIPQWTVAAPRYDALFAVAPSYNQGGLHFMVSDGKLKASCPDETDKKKLLRGESLYRIDSKTLSLREISVQPRLKDDADTYWQNCDIPETAALRLDSRSTAPDGYRFHSTNGYNADTFGWPFFGGERGHNEIVLRKDSRTIAIVNEQLGAFYMNNVQFLGWIVAEDNK